MNFVESLSPSPGSLRSPPSPPRGEGKRASIEASANDVAKTAMVWLLQLFRDNPGGSGGWGKGG